MVTFEEYQKKAFDFAADLTKQLITLSTSIVTLSLMFDKLAKGSYLAFSAWICYSTSTVCGLWTLMALTGILAPVGREPASFGLGSNVRIPSALQIFSFAAATALTIAFAYHFYLHG